MSGMGTRPIVQLFNGMKQPWSILVAVRTLTIMRIFNGHIQRGGEDFFCGVPVW